MNGLGSASLGNGSWAASRLRRRTWSAPGVAGAAGQRIGTGSVGLERPFLQSDLNASILYNAQLNVPFSYNKDDPPPGFQTLLLPYFEVAATEGELRADARATLDWTLRQILLQLVVEGATTASADGLRDELRRFFVPSISVS